MSYSINMPPPGVSLQLGATHLEDALQISRFQATLRFALQTKGNAIIERWIADGAVRDTVSVDHETTIERIAIAPDAVFTLRLLGEPEGCNRIHVFLDADRGTMTTKRFIVKMRGYWHYWRRRTAGGTLRDQELPRERLLAEARF